MVKYMFLVAGSNYGDYTRSDSQQKRQGLRARFHDVKDILCPRKNISKNKEACRALSHGAAPSTSEQENLGCDRPVQKCKERERATQKQNQ